MAKLNKFENQVIKQALELWVKQFENELNQATYVGKRPIYDISFPSTVSNDIKSKVDTLTLKK